MNAKNVIMVIILLLVFFGAGFGIAYFYFYQMQKPVVVPGLSLPATPPAVKLLSSKVVPSVAAYGKVTKIEGKNLTLTYQGETAVVTITNDAKIYSFTNTPAQKPKTGTVTTTKQIAFGDIKVEDTVNVTLRILSTGQVEGTSIMVSPATPVQTPPPANSPVTQAK